LKTSGVFFQMIVAKKTPDVLEPCAAELLPF